MIVLLSEIRTHLHEQKKSKGSKILRQKSDGMTMNIQYPWFEAGYLASGIPWQITSLTDLQPIGKIVF